MEGTTKSTFQPCDSFIFCGSGTLNPQKMKQQLANLLRNHAAWPNPHHEFVFGRNTRRSNFNGKQLQWERQFLAGFAFDVAFDFAVGDGAAFIVFLATFGQADFELGFAAREIQF